MKLTQTHFEELAQLLTRFTQCYATSNFDVGKIKVELTLPLKATAVFEKQRATCIRLNLQDIVQHLLLHSTHLNTFRHHITRKYRFSHNWKHIY